MPKFLSTDEIRRRFVAFFVAKGHKHLPPDSLVPANDKSVLFTGAGMNQFKDHFLGRAKLDHPRQRAVTVQPCVRTADIENVGRTPNHHACFEMLGNFSFGDYFKDEAVQWAAEFILDPEKGLGLEKERLSVTVYGGNAKLKIGKDEEAIAAWKKHAPWLKDEKAPGGWRIYEYGDHDNFWPADAPEQGPNGPCGPCSEIFYDVKPGQGAPESVAQSKDPDRYCEFWNLVFTQFNRVDVGKLEPLKSKNIDTGSGLERVARLLQGKPNNYEIDLLFPVVQHVSKICGKAYGKEFETDRRMRRITDHVRFAVFAIADGVKPGRNEREYVLRRLLRRAVLDGKELGIEEPFMKDVARMVIHQMKVGYAELTKHEEIVLRIIEEEEKAFDKTLKSGIGLLENHIRSQLYGSIKNDAKFKEIATLFPLARKYEIFPLGAGETGILTFSVHNQFIDGVVIPEEQAKERLEKEWNSNKPRLAEEFKKAGVCLEDLRGVVAFKLHDTFGFPIELTCETCTTLGIRVNLAQFESLVDRARRKSREGSEIEAEIFASGPIQELKAKYAGKPTVFDGYGKICLDGAKVLEIVSGEAGQALVLLDRTPFYAESGGQVSDTGKLVAGGREHRVTDMKKDGGLFFHVVELAGPLKVGDTVQAIVEDEGHRRPVQRNHSATHLLHLALRRVLGSHVEQRGSLVAPERLRFDFTHFEAIQAEQLEQIENCVNHLVRSDLAVETAEKPIAEAKAMGAMALFGEKYGDVVRVVQMGPSVELCGGTHVGRTGEIGYFRVLSEGSISSGIRRVEALTGQGAVEHARQAEATLSAAALALKTKPGALLERLKALQDEKAALERELTSLKKKAASATAGDLLAQAKDVGGAKLLAAKIDGADAAALRTTLDGIRKNLTEGAVVLAGEKDGKVPLLVSVSPELVKRGAHAGNLLKAIAPLVGGKGGGKPEMAQGGGSEASKIGEALAKAEVIIAGMLR